MRGLLQWAGMRRETPSPAATITTRGTSEYLIGNAPSKLPVLLLLNRSVRRGQLHGNLCWRWKLRAVPSSAKSLDKLDGVGHLLRV